MSSQNNENLEAAVFESIASPEVTDLSNEVAECFFLDSCFR